MEYLSPTKRPLRYLKVIFDIRSLGSDPKLDDTTQLDIPNSLKYLECSYYPFLYLPKTFQANNLVGLEMESSRRMVQLWEEVEKKDLRKLKFLSLSESKLKTFDLGLTPSLEMLSLSGCADFVELKVSVACPNLKFLNLCESRLRSLDLELIPNLERLDLRGCDKLEEINASIGCLKKVGYLNLSGCSRFPKFVFGGGCEPKVNCSSATLDLYGWSLDSCPLHPNSNLPKLQFCCYYEENLPSSVGNIEKLISFGLCACTDLKKISDIICGLQCLKELVLECDIPEFPKYLGRLECLEELYLLSRKIKHLPESICMLKHLKYLNLDHCAHLEKLPEDLGRLECLKELIITDTSISHLPQSIFGLKGLLIAASSELLQLYDFPSEIITTTLYWSWSQSRLQHRKSGTSLRNTGRLERTLWMSSSL